MINESRIKYLNEVPTGNGPIVYWMSRDQRVDHNWALLYAQQLAMQNNLPLFVVFTLMDDYPGANWRHFEFMLNGLKEVEQKLKQYNIPLILLLGKPTEVLRPFLIDMRIGAVICDFDPLQIKRQWKFELAGYNDVSFVEVDTHNIIPCWIASEKQEYNAANLRRKFEKHFGYFIEEFPEVFRQINNPFEHHTIQWDAIEPVLKYDRSVKPVDWIKPGESEAWKVYQDFKKNKLHDYDKFRNDPLAEVISDLSPYLHFGQIASQAIVLDLLKTYPDDDNRKAFLEQLIIRKELSDNYCFYNAQYDSFEGLNDWAKKTLSEHLDDSREYVYSKDEFELGKTHDILWNAAQKQLVDMGKMHGYLRMYWAKKILEWTYNPKEAFEIAVYLNDKYSLDGRDPNGYAGIAWSIGGMHDRPWFERNIFGKIRFMNLSGCKRKFNVDEFIQSINQN